ncbi:hypothetical protein E4T80_11890 [Muribacter muris]|uniref:Bro-N domain-containing protein n=1 Tax=Muribacter muris TaxID=67855 RepID=A0A4Y9JT90_9PAST|nr:Bro-N domain-containing protein [Muribacter muris]MBF0786161.1 Bro-N domain-containing protein [Muribacter muris]MBF0828308.1 Bro-N domain-containing protein [Muribacter muris]TFV07686.1 hypothetical protein E4T80_11890 [Muribacter muris]
MSNQVQFNAFSFKSSQVRVITDPNQEHWFCGADVCDILGYTNSRKALQDHCKQAGVTKRYISYPSGRKEAIFINEPNLYRLIIKSRKPEAEPFEAWVFEEVLPQIRKTGQYSLHNSQPNLPLVVEKKYTLTLTEDELRSLVWLWKSAERMRNILALLYKPLELLGSKFSAAVYGSATEYKRTLEQARKILVRETNTIETDKWDSNNWNNVLHELRKGELRSSL